FLLVICHYVFFFSSRRRHTRSKRDWSSDVCSSDLAPTQAIRWLVRSDGDADTAHPHGRRTWLRRAHLRPPARFRRPWSRCASSQIGRASCRERVEWTVVAGGADRTKISQRLSTRGC